jgi:hypothetical protein
MVLAARMDATHEIVAHRNVTRRGETSRIAAFFDADLQAVFASQPM